MDMFDKAVAYLGSAAAVFLALALAAAVTALGVQTYRVSSWKDDYKELKDTSEAKLATAVLDASVWKQKASNWQETAEKQGRLAKEAADAKLVTDAELARVKKQAETDKANSAVKLQELLKWKPPVGGDDCKESQSMVDALILERRQP